jgi:hypothetical protein
MQRKYIYWILAVVLLGVVGYGIFAYTKKRWPFNRKAIPTPGQQEELSSFPKTKSEYTSAMLSEVRYSQDPVMEEWRKQIDADAKEKGISFDEEAELQISRGFELYGAKQISEKLQKVSFVPSLN